MTAADATHLLQIGRSSGKVLASSSIASHADVSPVDDPCIPPLLCALLVSVYDLAGELSRVLQQDWASGWEGWSEAERQRDSATCAEDDHSIAE